MPHTAIKSSFDRRRSLVVGRGRTILRGPFDKLTKVMEGEVIINLTAFRDAIKPVASRHMREILFEVRKEMARLFGGRKTGRIYTRPKPATGTYRASAPGEPPAIASGRLFRSISEPRMVSPFQAEMVIDTPYAAILEGLERSGRVKKRPFVKPAIRRVKDRFNSVRSRF